MGASGTGKTTLATWISETYKIPINPVGSRSVSQAMGFASPYDVDKAGLRAVFQRRLLVEKTTWESDHESFVTDRTTLDNLAYTTLHDVKSITPDDIALCSHGMVRYTHIVWLPVDSFCNVGGDPARNDSVVYHQLYEAVLRGLTARYGGFVCPLTTPDIEHRKRQLASWLGQ